MKGPKLKKYYSANYILKYRDSDFPEGLFPWINNLPAMTRVIRGNNELFKPVIREGERGKRYYIRWKTAEEVAKMAERGELVLNNPKEDEIQETDN